MKLPFKKNDLVLLCAELTPLDEHRKKYASIIQGDKWVKCVACYRAHTKEEIRKYRRENRSKNGPVDGDIPVDPLTFHTPENKIVAVMETCAKPDWAKDFDFGKLSKVLNLETGQSFFVAQCNIKALE